MTKVSPKIESQFVSFFVYLIKSSQGAGVHVVPAAGAVPVRGVTTPHVRLALPGQWNIGEHINNQHD